MLKSLIGLRPARRIGTTLTLLLTAAVSAAQPIGTSSVRVDLPELTRYGVEEGLPSYKVSALARDERGHLWIASSIGLLRYDGFRFSRFEAAPSDARALRHHTVYAVTARREGGIWVWSGWGGLQHVDTPHDSFTSHPAADSLGNSDSFVHAIAETPDDVVWIAAPSGLYRYAPGAAMHRERIPGRVAQTLLVTGSGKLCAATAEGLWCRDESEWRSIGDPCAGRAATALTEDAAGALLAGCPDGVYKYGSEWNRLYDIPNAQRLAAEPSGALWVVSPNGFWFTNPGEQPTRYRSGPGRNALPGPAVFDLLITPEGTMWASVWGAGLVSAQVERSEPAYQPGVGGASRPSVLTAYAEATTIWLGSQTDGVCALDATAEVGTDCRRVELPGPMLPVSAFARPPDGVLRIAARGSPLLCLSPSEWRARTCPGLPEDLTDPRSLLVDRRGRLWVGTAEHGLFVADSSGWHHVGVTERLHASDSLHRYVLPLLEDGRGRVWVGSVVSGLYRVTPESDARFTVERIWLRGRDEAEGRLIVGVVSLAQIGDIVYAATRNDGIAAVGPDEHVRWYGQQSGLPTLNLDALAVSHGTLWAFFFNGAARMGADGLFDAFGSESGFGELQPYWHAAAVTGTHVFVGTPEGALAFAPSRLRRRSVLPDALVMALRVRGQPRSPASSTIELGPRESSVALDLAAMGVYPAHSWRFAYRLDRDGKTGQWIELPSPTLQLDALEKGSYTLRVRTQQIGQHGGERTLLTFAVAPFTWESTWFRSLILVLVAGLAYGAHRYRLFQISRRLTLRRSIADDLHDDLGAKAGAIALRLDLARRQFGEDTTEGHLRAIANDARQLVRDLRDVVWVVDGTDDRVPALVERVVAAARNHVEAHCLTLDIGALPDAPIPMTARRHLLLIIKEVVHNAAKHAQGAAIVVSARVTDGALEIVVSDSGPGFDRSTPSLGRGMKTIQRRASLTGATVAIDSREGTGTRVALRWPIPSH